MIDLATRVPLVTYVFIGEIIEEIISPIPSQLVLLTAGSLAQAQQQGLWFIVLLTIIAAVAKTFATILYYVLADKLEDQLVPRFGKYIGVTHESIEAIGKKLDKGGKREFISLFIVRCLPILPSAPVSMVCGAVKINFKTFFWATMAGNMLRGGMMLLTGYLGFDIFESFLHGSLTPRTWAVIVLFTLIAGLIVWGYIQRYTGGSNEKTAKSIKK